MSNYRIKIESSWKQESGKYKCPFCEKEFCEKGIATHIYSKHTDYGITQIKNRIPPRLGKSSKAWNKGLTKETSEIIKQRSEKIKQKYASGELVGSFKGKHHSEESKAKIRNFALKQKFGGLTKGSGRGKKGYYKGFWCDSSYELAYVIYCLDHNIQIERCKEYFEYIYQGQKHKYYPDFIVNNEIVEIKGFLTGKVIAKKKAVLEQHRNYKILFPKDMLFVFDYIREKYGKLVDVNISDLYDK